MNSAVLKADTTQVTFAPRLPDSTAKGWRAPTNLIPAQLMAFSLGATGLMVGGSPYPDFVPAYSMLEIERRVETSQASEVLNLALERARSNALAQLQQIQKNSRAIDLLSAWLGGGQEVDAEQSETVEYLKKALDEDRSSSRKLFQ